MNAAVEPSLSHDPAATDPAPSPPRGGGLKAGRSRATNGKRHIARPSRRTRQGRRYNDLLDAYSRELGTTYAALPESRRAFIRMAAEATVQAEMQQLALVNGETVEVDATVRLGNLVARCLEAAGLAGTTLESRQAEDQRRREAEEDAAIGLPPRRPAR